MNRYAAIIFLFLLFPCLYAYADETGTNGNTEAKSSSKIIGGTEAGSSAWPWMVALVKANDPDNYSSHFCGGSLIDSHWVLTAAHCITDSWGRKAYEPSELNIVTGTNDLSGNTGTRIGIKRIIVHPSYDPSTYKNDIALLELSQSVNGKTLPIFDGSEDLAGVSATAIGWGNTSATGTSYPKKLRQVSLPIVSNTVCSKAYKPAADTIYDCMLCAGYATGGKDTCDGDSGGPLVISRNSEWQIAGVTSWGEGCAQPGYYGVYSRISALKSFIAGYVPSAMKEDCIITPESLNISTASGNLPHTGESVIFTTEVFSACNKTVYYRYAYCPDYGTEEYDAINGWVPMSSGDGFSTSNTVNHIFTASGRYVVVAWVSPDRKYSDAISIAGLSVPVLP